MLSSNKITSTKLYYFIALIGISIPKGAIKDAEGRIFETLRFVVSTFTLDFQFLMQTGIDNPKYTEWGFIGHHPGYHKETQDEIKYSQSQINNFQFQIVDVVVKIAPKNLNLSQSKKN